MSIDIGIGLEMTKGGGVVNANPSNWLLLGGVWSDAGQWVDIETWVD
jgi:hypothetical protein